MKSINYDESKVPEYTLPSALFDEDAKEINSAFDWVNKQRKYILQLFEEHIYGELPKRPDTMFFEIISVKRNALKGIATRKEIRIHLKNNDGKKHSLDLLLYIPNKTSGTSPAFLGLNFFGNHSCSNEADILLSGKWMRPVEKAGIIDNRATEASRGYNTSRWPIKKIIKKGYALATLYSGDIYPDGMNKRKESVYKLFNSKCSGGAISAWAWGLSRAMDYLENDPNICNNKVIVIGHSRLGKAALWAGAQDQRFAMIITNGSGCGGAALSRRCFGESLESMLNAFPYWFCKKFKDYINKESSLPFDQHMLISLIAPRPVYIASAEEDLWADPKGEFLAGVNAAPVYRLFGSSGLACDTMPKVNRSIMKDIGYHIRLGGHNITEYDWNYFLNFSDKHLL